MGTASALDTLCGQSFGAKMFGMLGIQMQRAMFVLTLLSVPLSIIWFNTEHLLLFVGQDKSIATLAGSYARFMIPIAYLPMVYFNALTGFCRHKTMCFLWSSALESPPVFMSSYVGSWF